MTPPVPDLQTLRITIDVNAKGEIEMKGPPLPLPTVVGILELAKAFAIQQGAKPKSPLSL